MQVQLINNPIVSYLICIFIFFLLNYELYMSQKKRDVLNMILKKKNNNNNNLKYLNISVFFSLKNKMMFLFINPQATLDLTFCFSANSLYTSVNHLYK